jgi:cytoskeletal protein CcmA (bactofilin family)
MPNVTVRPVNKINVRVNQGVQGTIKSSSTFYGNLEVADQLKIISDEANVAYAYAQTAILESTTGYNFVTQGGTVNGDVNISNELFVSNTTYVTGDVNITGEFVGKIDGGAF